MELSMPLRRIVAITAALAIAPLLLAGCSAPAPVEEPKVTSEPTTAPAIPEEKEEEDAEPATGFFPIFDEAEVVSVQVPSDWSQIDGAAVVSDTGVQFYSVLASPDIDGYNSSWNVPGVVVRATQDFSRAPEEYLLDMITAFGSECGDPQTDAYDDGVYVGTYVYLPDCGGVGTEVLGVAVVDASATHMVLVQIQMVSDEDKTTTRDQILTTFFALL
jgi:serine protease Do